ncbi:hypothetical protein D9756_002897 [Leucocoprinus leucothites]|uniref:Ricin B lectin domain-containing protein n=1 Tax=Leucocoprinus leucothites TaxID=201217 RepID=A0A8H5G778_9AGAR|nr:hypothetical protein D9756_002897 [Leucoagaricus leucothites]
MSGTYEIINVTSNQLGSNSPGTECTKIIFDDVDGSPATNAQRWVFENTEGILYRIRNVETGYWATATEDGQVIACPDFDILTGTWLVNFNGSKTRVNVPAQNSYWTLIGDRHGVISIYLRPLNEEDTSAQEFEMRRVY